MNRRQIVSVLAIAFAASFFLVAAGVFVRAAAHERGLKAHGEARYGDALPLLQIAAHLGARDAAALVGVIYLFGQGTKPDGPRAESWLLRAAEADLVDAQTILGTMYANGVLIPRNASRARFWLEKAAAAGDKGAEQLLRSLPLRGNST